MVVVQLKPSLSLHLTTLQRFVQTLRGNAGSLTDSNGTLGWVVQRNGMNQNSCVEHETASAKPSTLGSEPQLSVEARY
jgi:hypothetical protein